MKYISSIYSAKMFKRGFLFNLFPVFIVAIYGAIIALIPSTFLLHKLLADRLNYFLMAKEIADHGSHVVSLAQNTPPLIYAYGASYLYAIPIKLSNLYEYQLLSVQILNLCLVGAFSALALRYVSSRLPGTPLAPITLLIAASVLFNSNWQLSVLAPNADILPALITVACFLAFQQARRPIESKTARPLQKSMSFAILIGVVGSFIKMSLITIPISLLVNYFISVKALKKGVFALVCAAGFGIAVMYFSNQTITSEYLKALSPYLFPTKQSGLLELLSSIMGSILNLVFSAIPDQIIPNFRHIFVEAYYTNTFNPKILTPTILLALLLGFGISSITIIGIINLWHTSRFEIIMLLICLPAFMIVTNSTARYLMAFQPLIWGAFIKGILILFPNLNWTRVIYAMPVTLLLILTQINSLSLRSRGEMNFFTRINEISKVYSDMLNVLRDQDATTTLGVQHFKVHQYSTMMWRASTNINFYVPDFNLPNLVKNNHILAIVTCVIPDCNSFEDALLDTFTAIEKTGHYNFNLIYSSTSSMARGEIYEITNK